MYSITIVDRATPAVLEFARRLNAKALQEAIGGGVGRLIIANFRALDSERANEMGGKRTHFYADAARGTDWTADAAGATVTIRKTGIAQRLFGGTILPLKGNWLTIPARREAYGKKAREFDNLVPIFGKALGAGAGALVARESSNISITKDRRRGMGGKLRVRKTGDEGGGVYFWLVKSVTQRPDPTVLPTDRDMLTAAIAAGDDYLRRSAART